MTILLPTTPTIREKIVAELLARLDSIDVVESVFESAVGELRTVAASGKFVLEVFAGADELADPAQNSEMFRLPIVVLAHIPPAAESPITGLSVQELAARICGAIYLAYTGDEGTATGFDLGGNAVDARVQSFCSGVMIDEVSGKPACLHELEVTYRFRRGNPGVWP